MSLFTGDWYSDNAIMYSILKDLTLYTGNDRAGTKFFIKNGKKTTKPQSCKFGTTWRCMIGTKIRTYSEKDKGYLTKLREEQPELHSIFKQFSDLHFEGFEWTDITINYMPKGTSMKLHLDKVNVGESILCAFGSYEGGNTFVKQDKGKNYKLYDCREDWIKFNGAEKKHFVSTVTEGERFSLVFYNSKNKF
jgi:hypothetical protein